MDDERMDELAGDPRFIPGIYIKLCRAATGMIRGELEGNEYDPQDANGSAKVALPRHRAFHRRVGDSAAPLSRPRGHRPGVGYPQTSAAPG